MTDLNDGRGPVAVIETGCFGIRLEVPLDAGVWSFDPSDRTSNRIVLQTLFHGSVSYLNEGAKAYEEEHPTSDEDVAMPLYGMPCSPVVRIDYPAFEQGRVPPALGDYPAPRFLKPITLVMPHNFDSRDDQESIAIVGGAAHGATRWEALATADTGSSGSDRLKLEGNELRVSIPLRRGKAKQPPRLHEVHRAAVALIMHQAEVELRGCQPLHRGQAHLRCPPASGHHRLAPRCRRRHPCRWRSFSR